jgi:hypothetical protein
MDKMATLVTAPDIDADPTFPKSVFLHKLHEEGLENNWSRSVMNRLDVTFTRTELDESMQRAAHETQLHTEDVKRAIECMHWLVESNYELNFGPSTPLSQRVIFSAMLLDLQNPLKVIGRLNEPLLEPTVDQTDGYVPNVVYTCGALVHGGRLILPYGLNDTATKIVTIELETLLAALIK